ncbi:MAG: GGDEF domain-containing protein, partial [Planctomycetota bacterium]
KLIRARLGHAEVAFVPAVIDSTGNAEPVPAASARTAIAVDVCAEPPGSGRHAAAAGSVLEGRLVLPAEAVPQENTGATRDAMAAHAAWLAAWMRLSGQNRALRRAAFTDPLTGAWNRRYSSRFLHAAVEKARVARRSLTVLYFDIDGFKRYNDDYGHAAGDEILVEVVRALRAVVRPSDRVCRVGGDEFVVIFYEPDGPRRVDSKPPESVYVLTKRVQQQIRERKFPKLGHEAAGRLTISGGLATYPWDGADAESLLHAADELAIRSKRQGKNAITLGPGAERVCGQPPRA